MNKPAFRTPLIGVVAALCLSGCSFQGLNSMVLPGARGTGDEGYDLVVVMDNATNLLPNSEVKVNDVSVGTVRKIGLEGWDARVEISVEDTTVLSADVRARIAQKSLLGAEYLELEVPSNSSAPRIEDGSTIPKSQTGRYPETEEVLAALSQVLNGGGLANLGGIVRELNAALEDPESARALIGDMAMLMESLRRQRSGIEESIASMDRLFGKLAAERRDLGAAIDDLGPGVRTLADAQPDLTRALRALTRLSEVGTRVIEGAGDDLAADVRSLRTVADALAQAGESLVGSLDLVATILFPVSSVSHIVKGDYLSVAVTLDVSVPMLQRGLLPSGPEQHVTTLLQSLLMAGAPTVPVPGQPPAHTDRGGTPSPTPDLPGGKDNETDPPPGDDAPDAPPAEDEADGGLLGFLAGGGS